MSKFPLVLCVLLLTGCSQEVTPAQPSMERIGLSQDGRGFIRMTSKQPFHPWGNNYGNEGRLMEDFWLTDWATFAGDFQEMKRMGANVVRVHLQFGKFMPTPDRLNPEAMRQLARMVQLAEQTGLYLDLTGLACYRQADIPAWYDALSDSQRWDVQARFWEGIAAQCAGSPAIFCYDLINEPTVTGGKRKAGDWYFGALGGYNFCQFINLDQADRPRDQVARQWIEVMTRAIHKRDRSHLITVGLLPTAKDGGCLSGFEIRTVAPVLDFVSVHIYPEKGKVGDATAILGQFAVGKPVVIEETFPLTCSESELREFLLESRQYACGWIGHYNGESVSKLETLRQSGKITAGQSLWLEWLRIFQETKPAMLPPSGA
jgi:hypothetical protein